MLSKPKYVKKASRFVVTERKDDANAKNSSQAQHWFETLEECSAFIKEKSAEILAASIEDKK